MLEKDAKKTRGKYFTDFIIPSFLAILRLKTFLKSHVCLVLFGVMGINARVCSAFIFSRFKVEDQHLCHRQAEVPGHGPRQVGFPVHDGILIGNEILRSEIRRHKR